MIDTLNKQVGATTIASEWRVLGWQLALGVATALSNVDGECALGGNVLENEDTEANEALLRRRIFVQECEVEQVAEELRSAGGVIEDKVPEALIVVEHVP